MTQHARLPSIDMLRGFVIALMALDHTRDFFGPTPFNPEDIALTTPGWFWTRWITHLCATVFVLLAGSSAFLRGQRSGPADLSRYLFTRGLMLLALEATWISFSWQFGYQVVILQVLWALGMGMVALAAIIWLPRWAIGLTAAILIVPHNLFDAMEAGRQSWPFGLQPDGLLWQAWHQGGFFKLPADAPLAGIVFMYPLMPWIGLIAAGYALGPVFLWERTRRTNFLLAAAGVMLLAFVVLRAFNIYGDPIPWVAQGRGVMVDLMAFAKVQKYPPSLLYLLVTTGLGLLLLFGFERWRENRVLMTFGRAPLLFYVIHIALIHLLGNLYLTLNYGRGPDFSPGGGGWPPGYEHSLLVVYVAWGAMLALMYGILVAITRKSLNDATGVNSSNGG